MSGTLNQSPRPALVEMAVGRIRLAGFLTATGARLDHQEAFARLAAVADNYSPGALAEALTGLPKGCRSGALSLEASTPYQALKSLCDERTANGTAVYHSRDFRTYAAERLRGRDGVTVMVQLCEELVGGRWEGFISVRDARAADGSPLSVRDALGHDHP